MRYKISAVVRTFGTILLTDGPGLSAIIRCIFFAPLKGKSAIINTKTPIPPTQWVKLRHIKMDLGRLSIFAESMILEPVVVNPETVSNNASI